MRSTAVIALALATFSFPVLSAPLPSSYCTLHPTDCARALVTRQVARDVVKLRPVHLGARSSGLEQRDLEELLERALDDESGAVNWGSLVKTGSSLLSGLSIGSTVAGLAGSLFHHGNSSRRGYDESGAYSPLLPTWRPNGYGIPRPLPIRVSRSEEAGALLSRDDLFELLARDLESEAINWGPIIQTAKKYLPHIIGAGAGLIPAFLPHNDNSGNQTRRDYEELLVRALDDESGAPVNLKPIIDVAKKWIPKVLSWGATAAPVASALIPHGGDHTNTTQTRRDFGELLARFNEQQERREAFERIARDIVVEGLLGRRALAEREMEMD